MFVLNKSFPYLGKEYIFHIVFLGTSSQVTQVKLILILFSSAEYILVLSFILLSNHNILEISLIACSFFMISYSSPKFLSHFHTLNIYVPIRSYWSCFIHSPTR